MKYTYTDEHSFLELEYLERGNDERERIDSYAERQGWTNKQHDDELDKHLRYIKARIPDQFWDLSLQDNVSRFTLTILLEYENELSIAKAYGLGFTFLGNGYKQNVIYLLAKDLCDRAHSVFVVSYIELAFYLRQMWSNELLRIELNERLDFDFLFVTDIPVGDSNNAQVLTELQARLQLRLGRNLPTMLSVNVAVSSLNDILRESFVGQLVFPFASNNKLVVIDELCNYDNLYETKWRKLHGDN